MRSKRRNEQWILILKVSQWNNRWTLLKGRIHREVGLHGSSQFTLKNSQGQNWRTEWYRCKLKFQTRKVKRIDNENISEVCDLISCTALMADFCLYCITRFFAGHPIESHLNCIRGWLHVPGMSNWLEKKFLEKWKVLEKKGLRSVWTMF